MNSPQLLLLSGIGPADHLKKMGIAVVKDLPGVGENLHNHVSFEMNFVLDEPAQQDMNVADSDLYLYNQTGPMSSTGLAQLTGILASNFTTADDPDLQIFFAGYQPACIVPSGIKTLESTRRLRAIQMIPVHLRPRSRGSQIQK